MKRNVEKCLKATLAKKPICYVLITCEAPSDDGHLQVKMSYEGDAVLAAYLLEGAQQFAHEFVEEQDLPINQDSMICQNNRKILYFE